MCSVEPTEQDTCTDPRVSVPTQRHTCTDRPGPPSERTTVILGTTEGATWARSPSSRALPISLVGPAPSLPPDFLPPSLISAATRLKTWWGSQLS